MGNGQQEENCCKVPAYRIHATFLVIFSGLDNIASHLYAMSNHKMCNLWRQCFHLFFRKTTHSSYLTDKLIILQMVSFSIACISYKFCHTNIIELQKVQTMETMLTFIFLFEKNTRGQVRI